MLHWEQGILSPTFQKFDFGSEELNTQHYGSSVPPLYDLSKLAVKTALFSGGHDYLADPIDVQRLVDELPADMVVLHNNQV